MWLGVEVDGNCMGRRTPLSSTRKLNPYPCSRPDLRPRGPTGSNSSLSTTRRSCATHVRVIIEVEPDLQVVGEAPDGTEALAAARDGTTSPWSTSKCRASTGEDHPPHRRTAPPPRVLVLTTFDHDEYAYESLRAGASGFLLKDVRRGQFTDAIRTTRPATPSPSPTITRRLIDSSAAPPSPAPPRGQRSCGERTEREVEVHVPLCFGRGNPTRRWRPNWAVAETTIKTHVAQDPRPSRPLGTGRRRPTRLPGNAAGHLAQL